MSDPESNAQDAKDNQNHDRRIAEGWHYCRIHHHYWWYGTECKFCEQICPCGRELLTEDEKTSGECETCLGNIL